MSTDTNQSETPQQLVARWRKRARRLSKLVLIPERHREGTPNECNIKAKMLRRCASELERAMKGSISNA